MRYVLVLGLLLFLIPATPAYAQAPCPLDTMPQHDMAGIYVDPSSPMSVRIYPCSGVRVVWDNAYGRHQAYYTMTEHLPGGGVVGHAYDPDPRTGWLDNTYTLVVKPGTRDMIEVITIDPYGRLVGMYRLPRMPD